ncbi:inverse autotransporter beta domain-containing protein [Amorphus sp. 3PC139-8]|uniref:inverse autotransporter beta domain-containing protein n=1 Tax=Amorphus sp. 3PC139-8 TaxID=2735676 RepID=UPI00345D8A48
MPHWIAERFLFVLILAMLCVFPTTHAVAQGSETSSSVVYEQEPEREYSDWERRIAREVIASGQMLEGDPRMEDAVSMLARRGRSLLSGGGSLTQDWVRENLRSILPELDNAMASAAMDAATNEMARGGTALAEGLAGAMTGLSGGETGDVGSDLQTLALRSGLEGLRAGAAASSLVFLNKLELEYSLTEGGLDEYSILSVQPLWSSEDLHHNVFAQGSFSKKEVEDIGTGVVDRRKTANAGLAYRYITDDEQHMFGANAFFDHQWPYHHSRMSLGVDYKTSLYGVSFNKYFALSDWRGRGDGYEEKALGGEDIEVSGRAPKIPELEVFAKGYHWIQEKTDALNPDGDDIWGYQFAMEYTPVNAFTIRSSATKDNAMDDLEGEITLRLNYRFGQGFDEMWERPSYNLASVMDRRFDKVRRTNEIRVQVRQDPDVTAQVTFAQGANVSVGQALNFGATITTGNSAGDAVTVVFGNGARLDVGQNSEVRLEEDAIVLLSGLIQFTSGDGGISTINTPGGTIALIGTDVDVRTAGSSTTLRVRDGAADFTDDSGTTRVNTEQLGESQDGDAVPPQIKGEATATYETHATEAHAQLDLIGPTPTNRKAAPYASDAVTISGTLANGNTLSFTVPLTEAVTVTGTPRLYFTLGGQDRYADYTSGSGTNSLIFSYSVAPGDVGLSNIYAQKIEKNGGTLKGIANSAPMVRQVSGTLSGSVPITILFGQSACPAGDLSEPGDVACARLFGSDPTDMADVGIFAGELPDGTEIFVKRCDQGATWNGSACVGRTTLQWSNASGNDDATTELPNASPITATAAVDGPGNTDDLIDTGAPAGTYPAAESCRALGADWYLPAVTELDVIYSNLEEGEHLADDDTDNPRTTLTTGQGSASAGNNNGPLVAGFDTSGQYYWSSSETPAHNAWIQRFSDGNHGYHGKIANLNVRCARR